MQREGEKSEMSKTVGDGEGFGITRFRPVLHRGKDKGIPLQAWTGPRRLRLPEFLDNLHTKVVRLSALRTGCLYPQQISLVLIC
jgi:hypothetical protein